MLQASHLVSIYRMKASIQTMEAEVRYSVAVRQCLPGFERDSLYSFKAFPGLVTKIPPCSLIHASSMMNLEDLMIVTKTKFTGKFHCGAALMALVYPPPSAGKSQAVPPFSKKVTQELMDLFAANLISKVFLSLKLVCRMPIG
jgi:hypothetical protein